MLSTARIRSTTKRVVTDELPLAVDAAHAGPFTSPGAQLGEDAVYAGPFTSPAMTAADKKQTSTQALSVLNID